MPPLPLTLACGPYDRTLAIRDGSVAPDSITLTTHAYAEPAVMFAKMANELAFDVSEYSCSGYFTEMTSGHEPAYVAIPVFPSRFFRHGFIFVNKRAGIQEPKDLKGKRIGIPVYAQTAAIWMRGMLADDYGVLPEHSRWFVGGVNGPRMQHPLDRVLPGPDVSIVEVPAGNTLSAMLASGELDAVMSAATPHAARTMPDVVGRLFPDFRTAERDYYRRTRIFPIMHTLVVKRSVLAEHPWVARSIAGAFEEAKRRCYAELRASRGALPYVLPWLEADIEEMDSVFGGDAWPNGFDANRHTLDALMRYLVQQGLVTRPRPVEELFVT